MRVKSAIDLPFKIIIYMTIAILIVSAVIVPKETRLVSAATASLVIVFLLWIYLGTYYEFRDDYLYCKSGPFAESIPYSQIRSARLCQSMLSSMALSSKRIEIRQHRKGYMMGTTMISPMNREEFLEKLLTRCNNIQ